MVANIDMVSFCETYHLDLRQYPDKSLGTAVVCIGIAVRTYLVSFEYQRDLMLMVLKYRYDPFNDLYVLFRSFPACRVKSVGSTAPLEKCCKIRKLDNISYHARGASLRP
ncbi:hypothetical protein Tco_0508339 [Tanacetum coccineum]